LFFSDESRHWAAVLGFVQETSNKKEGAMGTAKLQELAKGQQN
jgi:hypothetical protein